MVGHDELPPQRGAGFDCEVHALVAPMFSGDQIVVSAGADGVLLHVDRRMDDLGIASVVFPDSVAHEGRVGDELVDTVGRQGIGAAKATRHGVSQRSNQCRQLPEVDLPLIPDVAQRRMAVADVSRIRGRDNPLRGTGFARHDEVVRIDIQDLKRKRHQCEIDLVSALREGQPGDECRSELATAESAEQDFRPDHMGEKVRVRENLSHCLEHNFAASLADEPIVNESGLHSSPKSAMNVYKATFSTTRRWRRSRHSPHRVRSRRSDTKGRRQGSSRHPPNGNCSRSVFGSYDA